MRYSHPSRTRAPLNTTDRAATRKNVGGANLSRIELKNHRKRVLKD